MITKGDLKMLLVAGMSPEGYFYDDAAKVYREKGFLCHVEHKDMAYSYFCQRGDHRTKWKYFELYRPDICEVVLNHIKKKTDNTESLMIELEKIGKQIRKNDKLKEAFNKIWEYLFLEQKDQQVEPQTKELFKFKGFWEK